MQNCLKWPLFILFHGVSLTQNWFCILLRGNISPYTVALLVLILRSVGVLSLELPGLNPSDAIKEYSEILLNGKRRH